AVAVYKKSNKPNLAKLAREFAVPINRARGRVNGRKSNSTIASRGKGIKSNIRKKLIKRSANQLLKDASSDWQVGYNWINTDFNKMRSSIGIKPATKLARESGKRLLLLPVYMHILPVV
ncbi:hypothetical protein N7530_005678, partial [Penicillium desertorum]